ncbi:MAG: HEAT repeat domain-containing protein [Oscillatoria princeps RMCB-10]|jgi:predicted NACHT family NTPase|nr:HEAT repeat domain-containing protein [Oscillatoria princeps RMCB-10]
MVDWLVVWGVTQAVGFAFKPILEDLAKDAGKDFVKDLFKDCLKSVLHLPSKEPLEIAAGKALKYFLQLVQQELEDADVDEQGVKDYTQPLKQFIKDTSVAEILGSAFKEDCPRLDTRTLSQTWKDLNLPALPDNFDWERVAKRYLKRAKAIRQESDELREIISSQNLDSAAESLRQQTGITPDFDLRKHQEGIRERYGNLKLDSFDTTGSAYNALKLWRMFIPQNVRESQEFLPKVYDIPKEYQRRLRESGELEAELLPDELERHREVYSQQPVRSVLEVVQEPSYKYVVILGDPGSGKSTLLQYLALEWAELPVKELSERPIPLLVELRTYMINRDKNQCKDFLEFFHKGTGIVCRLNQHDLHEWLKAGNAIVMFDGLDEVFDPKSREEVIADIHRFTNDYPNVRVIVTSRVIGYKPQRLRDAEFRHFVLQDLEPEQIQEFISRWHDLTFNDEADKVRKRERLQKAIEESSAIRELAGNPLLLTMMAILNRNQELPRDRPELYNQASRVLLHQWDIERALSEDSRLDPKTIDYKDKQAMLRQVAYAMQGNEKGLAGNLISGSDLETILIRALKSIEVSDARTVARVLINQLRVRNFILCSWGGDYYAFVHRTFLEYFCAWEFVERFGKRGAEGGLSLEQLKTEVFGAHWRDESWHEVLRLIAGMVDAQFAGEIIEYLMGEAGEGDKFMNRFLAAGCLAEVRNRTQIQATATKLLAKLKGLTKYDLNYYYDYSYREETELVREIRTRAVAAIATAWQDDGQILSWLKERAGTDDDWDVRIAAVQELAWGWKDHPDTLPWLKERARTDDNGALRQAAVEELARGWKNDPDTLPWLKERARTDDNWDVREAAVRELAWGWKDHPDTLPWLKERARTDDNWNVRIAAVQELARGWKNDPDTLPWLKERARTDDDWTVRYAAVQELARGWKDHPDTLPWLKERARTDDDSAVRIEAVQELARGWKNDPDTLPWLKERARTDDNWNVRIEAVQELARGWKNDPDTLPWLKERARTDDNWAVRKAAVQELARGWKDDPDTLPMLKKRARTDDNWAVREAAVQELARGWKDDPDTLPMLKERARTDDNSAVRIAAVQELARGWKDHRDTLPMLKERARTDDNSAVRIAAVRELARGWKDEPELFELLRTCAVSDPFERQKDWQDNPRQTALAAIVKLYPNHPQTLPLLRERAENDPDEKVRKFAQKTLAKWR